MDLWGFDGPGFRVWGLGFFLRAFSVVRYKAHVEQASGHPLRCRGFRVEGLECRVYGFRGAGFRASGVWASAYAESLLNRLRFAVPEIRRNGKSPYA